MPGKARIDIPGLLQYVIVGGIERRNVFLDDGGLKVQSDEITAITIDTGFRLNNVPSGFTGYQLVPSGGSTTCT